MFDCILMEKKQKVGENPEILPSSFVLISAAVNHRGAKDLTSWE